MFRTNRFGLQFVLTQDSTGTLIETKLFGKPRSIHVDHDVSKLSQSWYHWQYGGLFVQDAFRYLSDEEREFLQTGMLQEDFTAATKEDNDVE